VLQVVSFAPGSADGRPLRGQVAARPCRAHPVAETWQPGSNCFRRFDLRRSPFRTEGFDTDFIGRSICRV